MSDRPFDDIVRHYEECLVRHGGGAAAVDWKSESDAEIRYEVMLGLLHDANVSATVVDLGCGLAGLRDHMERRGLAHLCYTGIDVSEAFIASARKRRPDLKLHVMDILEDGVEISETDYVIMNGVFTRRQGLTETEMFDYTARMVSKAFALARKGIAFNVMSSCVDWKNEVLFYPDAGYLTTLALRLSRHWVLRNDYGLFETTCYIYRNPSL